MGMIPHLAHMPSFAAPFGGVDGSPKFKLRCGVISPMLTSSDIFLDVVTGDGGEMGQASGEFTSGGVMSSSSSP